MSIGSKPRRTFQGPVLAVDGIVLRGGSLLLVRRRYPPFEGRYALPGGMVETGETVERAVVREVREETGLRTAVVGLVGVYSDPRRDPRGHVISVVFRLRLAGGSLRARSDASDASFHPLDDLPRLAFDHARIVRDVVRFQRTSEGNRRRTSRRRG